MKEFKQFHLGQLGKVVTGKTPKTKFPENFGNKYMFIGPTDLHQHYMINKSVKGLSKTGFESIKNNTIRGLSILVGCIGWDMGNVALVNSECATNQQINSITEIKREFDPHYIYYWLKGKKSYLFQIANVTRTPMLNKTDFSKVQINIPELSTQKQIAKVLSDLDAKIEVNNQINQQLEAMAKTLYDYWFVQFDFPVSLCQPELVEGDVNGTENKNHFDKLSVTPVKPYKSSGGKMVYNEELKRKIPDGWEVKELNAIAKCLMGQSPKGSTYNKEGIGMALLNGPADYENGALKGRTFTTDPKRICVKDDLVLCIRATIGNLVYAEQEFCLGRGVAAVRPKEIIFSELIYFYLLQEIERFKIQATGSIIRGITKDDLIESKCLIPSNELINLFHSQIKPQFDKIRINKTQNQKLMELRDWLLPMLMNGQVQVNSSDAGDVDGVLGMVAESGGKYGKG